MDVQGKHWVCRKCGGSEFSVVVGDVSRYMELRGSKPDKLRDEVLGELHLEAYCPCCQEIVSLENIWRIAEYRDAE